MLPGCYLACYRIYITEVDKVKLLCRCTKQVKIHHKLIVINKIVLLKNSAHTYIPRSSSSSIQLYGSYLTIE